MDGTYQTRRRFWHSKTSGLWPWAISICAHLAVLAVFTSMKLAVGKADAAVLPTPKAEISQIKKIINTVSVFPKPKVKKNFSKPAPKPTFESTKSNTASVLEKPSARLDSLAQNSLAGRYSLPSSGSALPGKIELFNVSTDQRKICYVIDSSGSMQGLFARVIGRVKESIQNLQPDQYFYIIFFGSNQLLESGDGTMIRAAEYAKSDALNFLASVKPAGKTNALAAIKRAMQIRDAADDCAEVIYFLTDGFELSSQDAKHFVAEVQLVRKKLAPQVKINTIGFWTQPKDCLLLKTIAEQSDGKFVSIDEQFN